MGDVVDLRGRAEDNQEFVADLARYSEGLLSEAGVRKKYRLTERDWEELGDNDALVKAIEQERLRRVRDGSAKREKAAPVSPARDYRLFRFGTGQIRSLETNRQFTKARHWRAFLALPG